MTAPFILHHYDASPYAEKIRLMFGLTGAPWQSVIAPAQPPRPSVDPLTGGYRRIPVAQIGADIFCDTAVIAREVAAMTGHAALDPSRVDPAAAALMERAEKQVFFAAITAVAPLRLLTTMLLAFGPVGAYRFIKDRAGLLKGGTVRPAQGEKAKAVLANQLEALDALLADRPWVGGEAPGIADFTVYHPLWLHVSCNRRPLKAGPRVEAWYARVAAIGQGPREEITPEQAFAAARQAEPRPLPTSVADTPVAVGASVAVAPSDYGLVPVTGTLAAVTADRIIVARKDDDLGTLHVHFPRAGYSLVAR
jgi:glutathione S-transferase